MSTTNEVKNSTNRTVYLDLLRITATLGVLIIHTAAQKWHDISVNSLNWEILNFYHSFPRWGVPLFVMISGVFHLRPAKEGTSFQEEMKVIYKKVFRIVSALVFWGVFCNLVDLSIRFFVIHEPVTLIDIVKTPAFVIFWRGYYHLWFLYVLIGLYLLTPIFRIFVNNCKKEHIEYFLLLFFIVETLALVNNIFNCFPIFKGQTIYFTIIEMTGGMGYYVAGYYFANYKLTNKTKNGIYIIAVLFSLFTIIGSSILSIYNKEPKEELLNYLLPNSMVVAFAIFLLFQQIFNGKEFSESKKKFISKLSKDTFGIYLIHAVILKVLFDAIGINMFMISPIFSVLIIAIAVMFISEIGTILISKIPVLSKYII